MVATTEKLHQVAIRLPLSLVKRLDRHVKAQRQAQPGVRISRSDVIRNLLLHALAPSSPVPTSPPRATPAKAARSRQKA
jgi:metal-responsive CopG/Arc/MetJ family transcriptional regulator